MRKTKNAILISIIVIFALIFVGACGYLVVKWLDYGKINNDYKNIASSYASGISETQAITAPGDINTQLAENPIDFKSLKEQNDDIYSWIYIPDTNVNYPVCRHSSDDNFYLDHDIYGNYSYAGTIYSQFCNGKDYLDRVTVLYGHNMADGSMFADLHKYRNKEYFDENKYIYIYTETSKLTYEIVSAFVYDDRHIINSFDFSDDKVYQDYLDSILNPHSIDSNVREGMKLDVNDRILVLSTCLNSGEGRYLVQGVLINDEQTK